MGVVAVLLFGPVGWVCLAAWRMRDERIEVGPADITLYRADGSRLSMSWDSIVALIAGFAVAMLVEGHLPEAASGGGALIVLGLVMVGEIRSVKVGPSEVVRKHFLWARRIPYPDIAGIDLEDVPIRYRRGEEIELPTFPEGLLRLFDSLSTAWEQGKDAADRTPGQAR